MKIYTVHNGLQKNTIMAFFVKKENAEKFLRPMNTAASGHSIIENDTWDEILMKDPKEDIKESEIHFPNIEKALKIVVERSEDGYHADATVLPGTPIVGRGKSEVEAKYNLVVNFLYITARAYRKGSDSAYAKIILDLLDEDMEKLGEKIER